VPIQRPESTPTWLTAGRIPSLDGWRAVAVLLVLCVQVKRFFHDSTFVTGVLGKCGFVGVQVFFVISGFLITTLLLRENDRTGGISLRLFYYRRMLRILPAYGLYLAVLLVLQLQNLTYSPVTGRQWAAALTYTVNFLPGTIPGEISHLWSLSVEEHFYLLWPVLLAVCGLAAGYRLAAACVAGCLIARWLALATLPPEVSRRVDVWTFTRFDDIAVGCLLAFLARSHEWRTRLDRATSSMPRMAFAAILVLAAQLLSARQVGARFLPEPAFSLAVSSSNTVTAVGIAVLMWRTLGCPATGLGKLLNHSTLRVLGVLSYSVYLWHHLFSQPRDLFWCRFPQNVVFLLAAATASYLFVERPFLRLKNRLDQSPNDAASQSRAVPS